MGICIDQSVTRGIKFPVEHHQSFFIFTIGQLKAGQRMELSKYKLINFTLLLLRKENKYFCENISSDRVCCSLVP